MHRAGYPASHKTQSELQAPFLSVPHLIAREYELFIAREETGRPSLGLEGRNMSWPRAGDQWEEEGTWDMNSLQHEQAPG